jgi:hypothetical protein
MSIRKKKAMKINSLKTIIVNKKMQLILYHIKSMLAHFINLIVKIYLLNKRKKKKVWLIKTKRIRRK